ncbi:protein kinase domain-containing protein [Archangium lipolyticum]|uniref:protein kinase domain-containing protein n=1 Tax=Archangium lipolyticum TaxID=2970465 RepID=UPI00214A5359|nr:protein kinase [Archangium lipolyticum]
MLLDRYEILSELGRGGFGTVYKARQLATGQSVAIKVLHGLRGLGDEDQQRHIARFQREMRLCGQLHHPNIVRLIDSGVLDDGRVYTAFEYVPGQTLAKLLAEGGALAPTEARHLMLQTLDALSCAHSIGVVHRDLKPHNIMVVATGARRNALVLDFGLATLVDDSQFKKNYATLTGAHEVLGTPAYSAPEQLRGLAATPSSDLFSWALVFLECLTGVRPVRGRTMQEIIFQQLGPHPIPMPSALRAHPLGRILARLLSKDPEARQVKSGKLLREIDACDLKGLQLPVAVPERASTGPEQKDQPSEEKDVSTHTAMPQVGLTAPKPVEGAHSPQLEDKRHWHTALCCTLNLTPKSKDGFDLEESDECIQLGQQVCIEVGRSFSGSLGSILGDQVLLYFGLEARDPEHAQNAAYAALELIQELRRRSARAPAHKRESLEVRASLHSGPTVAHRAGLLGTVPRIAAQLSTRAPPGRILVSADTAQLLRASFILELEGEHGPASSSSQTFWLKSQQGHRANEPVNGGP